MRADIIQHVWGEGCPPPVTGASLVFADPPYNFGIRYADDPSKDQLTDYYGWARRTIGELTACLAPGGTLWWLTPECHGDTIGLLLTSIVGRRIHRVIFEEAFSQYQQTSLTLDYRMLFCHQKPGGDLTFNPDAIREESERQRLGDKRADPRGRVPGQVWKMRRLQGTALERVSWHPTQLPPELLRRVTRGWTSSGDLVVDAFAGSANLGVICQEQHRQFVGCDRSPTYCELMRERLKWTEMRNVGSHPVA